MGAWARAWRVFCTRGPAYETHKRRQVVALFFAVETLYLMTIFLTPGFVRREAAAVQQQASVGAGPDGERVAEKGLCKKCNTVKPPRAHHCNICRRYGVPLARSLARALSRTRPLSLVHALSRCISRARALSLSLFVPLSLFLCRVLLHASRHTMSSLLSENTHALQVCASDGSSLSFYKLLCGSPERAFFLLMACRGLGWLLVRGIPSLSSFFLWLAGVWSGCLFGLYPV